MPKLSKSEFRHNAKVYTKTCAQCGVTFYANKPAAIYCSSLCRTNAYIQRKKSTTPANAGDGNELVIEIPLHHGEGMNKAWEVFPQYFSNRYDIEEIIAGKIRHGKDPETGYQFDVNKTLFGDISLKIWRVSIGT